MTGPTGPTGPEATPSYGGVYVYDGAVAQSISNGTTPIQMTCWSVTGGSDGRASGVTPQAASSNIKITRAGKYQVIYNVSFLNNSSGSLWEFYIFSAGTQDQNTGAQCKTGTAGEINHVGGFGFIDVAIDDTVDLRCYHDVGSPKTITVGHANLNVVYVGP